MSTAYCPPDSLIEEYSKSTKQAARYLPNSVQQSVSNNQLPSIFSVMPSGSSPQIKAEESAQVVNYFNNPYPVYYQTQSRRETDTGFLGFSTNTSASAQATTNYLPATMSPQSSYSGGHNLFAPIPPKAPAKKVVKSAKNSDRCTCKRLENHIPRPRNAFILFRQKHHQSVLKESTKSKTNPEVSRELARRWRALSVEERDHWNNLADEEKKNHAKKYPNYRYKPRRHKKSSQCAICQVKRVERQPTPQHNFTMFQEYPQIAQDSGASKSPVMQSVPQTHLQMQHQHRQQMQQESYQTQKYMHYGSYHQNQFAFGDAMPTLGHSGQQPSPSQTQQQHYQLQVQQRPQNQIQSQNQSQNQNQNQAYAVQNASTHSSQAMIGSQFQVYADKYHETATYQYQEQSGQGQKYNGLPAPMGNNIYNGHDAFTVPTSLQSY